ncbi:MAG TPA: histidine kinase [Solirubrobacterales bacterium]|nr:histidine kinase [Solirubrobacterales bacterium]
MASIEVKQGLEAARWQRWLLPGSMVGGPGAERSLRDWGVDALLTAGALGVGVIGLHDTWQAHDMAMRALDVLLGIASLAALWDRRNHPVGVAAFVVGASAISALAGGAALIVLFNVAIRCDRRTLAWVALATLAASVIEAVIYNNGTTAFDQSLFSVFAIGFIVGWGLFVRVRRDLVDSLHERNARLEEEGRLRADQARAAERERIAREMHDVLAHRISLLSLHAGALEYRPDAPPEEIAATAGVVREAAAAALEELRDVIGVLREGTEGESRPPQPRLADLPALIEESRVAGMRIEAELDLPEAGGPIGRTAYRVVQEGLTNARKHAPGVLVSVKVTAAAETLRIEIRNPAPLSPPPAAALPGAGSGLIGLGERVQLADGVLRHEWDDAGGFVLIAMLPVEAAA